MKPLIVLIRIIIIGCFWSVFFLEGIRVIMLRNWRFDIISYEHWEYAWDLWISGWIISDAKEWAFVLIIVTFIPLWLTGWAALSLISWENIITDAVMYPVKLFQKTFQKQIIGLKKISHSSSIKKKPSYKEIRPRSTKPVMETASKIEYASDRIGTKKTSRKQPKPIFEAPAPKSNVFEHSLLSLENEEDDFVFNFDAFDTAPKEEKPKNDSREYEKVNKKTRDRDTRDNRDNNKNSNKDTRDNKNNRDNKNRDNKDNRNKNASDKNERVEANFKPGSSNIIDIIKQKGYEIITGSSIKNNLIDFVGVSKNKLILCILDREPGDWLADEERFNDEEPLWFSESSHRISPVRKIDISRKYLENLFTKEDLKIKVEAYVILQLGNIINAEDMFDIWNDMDIRVTRIDRGSPKDIMLFAKGITDASASASEKEFDRIKKLIRG